MVVNLFVSYIIYARAVNVNKGRGVENKGCLVFTLNFYPNFHFLNKRHKLLFSKCFDVKSIAKIGSDIYNYSIANN